MVYVHAIDMDTGSHSVTTVTSVAEHWEATREALSLGRLVTTSNHRTEKRVFDAGLRISQASAQCRSGRSKSNFPLPA